MITPRVEVMQLDDGSVEVRVGDQVGVVSSHHLVEPKANQLRMAWLREHNNANRGS